MADTQRLSATVIGRVQGVGFRYFVEDEARALGLVGYVRNDYRDRRRLEVVAEGPPEALARLVTRLEEGPSGARVEAVETYWQAAQGNFLHFRITY